MIQSLLVEQGHRVGAFFSPFVVDPRERIQLGRDWVGKRELARAVHTLMPFCKAIEQTQFGPMTEFELKTALGVLIWKRNECDWVALEVGLGGELDATNIVSPRACVIVSIGYDHQNVLGPTLTDIARAKAGIMKPGVPVVVGSLPDEAMQVVQVRARELECPLWRYGHEIQHENGRVVWPGGRAEGIKPPLGGLKQPENAALAIAATAAAGALLDTTKIAGGIAGTKISGRMQRLRARGCDWLIDGAHNIDSARHLAETATGQQFVLIAGMLQGHDPGAFFGEIRPLIVCANLTPIQDARSFDPENLTQFVPSGKAHPDLRTAMRRATEQARKRNLPILVTGSFYLVGEVLRALGSVAAVQNDVSNLGLSPQDSSN